MAAPLAIPGKHSAGRYEQCVAESPRMEVENVQDAEFHCARPPAAPVRTATPSRDPGNDLTGSPTDGFGNHWWRKLGLNDYLSHQLPNPAAGYTMPVGW